MHLCGWSHLFQDFFPFSANRTTANKQEAPCTQLRARECGEGVVYRPPNNIIPLSHPHPLAAYPGKSKVCANSANQGPWDESQGQPAPPGVEATANTARASCLSCGGPAAPHPSTRAKLPKAGFAPQPEQRQRGTDLHLLHPGRWSLINVPRQGTARNTFPERTCWELLFKPGCLSLYLCPNLYFTTTRERERQRQSKREGENLSRRKGRAN